MKQLAIALALVACLSAVGGHAQVVVPPEESSFRTFILAAYPELAGRALQIQSNGTVAARDVAVFEVVPSSLVEATHNTLIAARVEFSDRHELKGFSGSGPLLHDTENADLRRAVQAAGTATAITSELARRGLPFGPSRQDAILAKVAEIHFDATIGSNQVLSASSASVVNDPHYGFLWTVELVGTRASDVSRHYLVDIEPFGGRLVRLRER